MDAAVIWNTNEYAIYALITIIVALVILGRSE